MTARNERERRGGGARHAGWFSVLVLAALALLGGLGARAASAASTPVVVDPDPQVDESGSVIVRWQAGPQGAGGDEQISVTLRDPGGAAVGIWIQPLDEGRSHRFEGLSALETGTRLSATATTMAAGDPLEPPQRTLFNLTVEVASGSALANWTSAEVTALAAVHGGKTPSCTVSLVPAGARPSREPVPSSAEECPAVGEMRGRKEISLASVPAGSYIAVLGVTFDDGMQITSATTFAWAGAATKETTTTAAAPSAPSSLGPTPSSTIAVPSTTAVPSGDEAAAAGSVPASSSAPYAIGVVALVCGLLVLGAMVVVLRNRRAAGELDLGGAPPADASGVGPPPVAPAAFAATVPAPPAEPATPAASTPTVSAEAPMWPADAVVPLPVGSVTLVSDDPELDGSGPGGSVGRLEPVQTELGTTWAHEGTGLVVSALWLERRAGKGEDAEPSFAFDPASGSGMLATYDGTGGSGAAPAQVDADGAERSGAYVAGRLARRAAERWFAQVLTDDGADAPPEVQLHDELAQRFAHEGSIGVPSSEKFAGSLRRELPTTIAATVFHARGDTVSLTALWAGDSRCHILTPDAGMQQLSVDDTPIRDALEAITTDAPMSNLVSADRAFEIRRRDFEFAQPVVLVSSTDGCFGYVATPAHFEYLLLESLQASVSASEWAAKVLAQLDGFAGDDASLVLLALGWRDFAALQGAFAARASFLRTQHWAPFDQVNPADRDRFSNLRLASWRQYKQHYEEHLPRPNRPDPNAAADPTAPAPALATDPGEGRPVPER